MITGLKSLARAVSPLALDFYDREDPLSLLAFLAQIVQNPDKEKTLTLEWWSAFPELRKWVGERTSQKAFQDALIVKSEPYEVTMDFDKNDAERASGLVRAEDLALKIAKAFVVGKVLLAYRILKTNALTYDGQNFFDTDHTHPNDTVFSNIVSFDRAVVASPTVQEARSELKAAMARLQENRLVRNELISDAEITNSLVVITRSFNTWSAYRDLNTEEQIDAMPNRFRGKFNLLRDLKPPAGQEDSVDIVEALPGGPRPAVFVPTREPTGLQFDESKVFSHHLIPFGMDSEYGVAAGFPQTAARITPT